MAEHGRHIYATPSGTFDQRPSMIIVHEEPDQAGWRLGLSGDEVRALSQDPRWVQEHTRVEIEDAHTTAWRLGTTLEEAGVAEVIRVPKAYQPSQE